MSARKVATAKKFKHEMNGLLDKHYDDFRFDVTLMHITGLFVGVNGLVKYREHASSVTIGLKTEHDVFSLFTHFTKLNGMDWLKIFQQINLRSSPEFVAKES